MYALVVSSPVLMGASHEQSIWVFEVAGSFILMSSVAMQIEVLHSAVITVHCRASKSNTTNNI